MTKYYSVISGQSHLKTKSGSAIEYPIDIDLLSAKIISRCSFLQGQIQRIIFVSHGENIEIAKRTLSEIQAPRRRIEFLISFEYDESDRIISMVFQYAQRLFSQIYEIRNVLAHEIWHSSEDHKGCVLFSQLEEEARLLYTSGDLMHKVDARSQRVYDATIRYINSFKIVNCDMLRSALKDAELCSWILMTISHFVGESDKEKRLLIRNTFLVFKGTSHLFSDAPIVPETIEVESIKINYIHK